MFEINFCVDVSRSYIVFNFIYVSQASQFCCRVHVKFKQQIKPYFRFRR